MDLELLGRGLAYAKKKKKWVLILGALGYAGYRICSLHAVVKKRQRLLKLFTAMFSVAEMVSDSADAAGILSKDLKEFLGSDSDQVPQSLKQISKIVVSNEFSTSLTRITTALSVGVLRCYQHELIRSGEDSNEGPGFLDRVMDKLFSEAGSGFASVAVGSFARNMVMALYSALQQDPKISVDNPNSKTSLYDRPGWVDIICDDKCKELISDCTRLFVTTAVTVYLDKTMNINMFDEIFSGLTNPKHEAKVRDMLVSVSNGAAETCIRTSYNLWSANSVSKLNSSYSKIDFEDGFSGDEKPIIRAKLIPTTSRVKRFSDKNQDSGWVRKMSSTLAVPNNRKLVLDVTGVATFEAVRSFMEFVLEKTSESMKRSVDVVHHEVVDKGVEAIRSVSGKSSAVGSLCLTLCLNVVNSPWIFGDVLVFREQHYDSF